MNYNFNLAKEKEVKASLKDLDFGGWLQFIQNANCILAVSSVFAFIPFTPALAALSMSSITGGWFLFWTIVSYLISYVITIVVAWCVHCGECKQCELQKICKKQLEEKKRLAHEDYMNDRKSEIEAVHQEINRLRTYMDKLLSFDNKSQMVRDEVDRTLKQIAMYEEMVSRYEKEVKS